MGLLILFLIAGVAIEFIGLFATILFWFSKVRPLDESQGLPGVTILKPCRENDDNEEENFGAFFQQDYPGKVELLFIVASESHPIVPIIRKYLALYPQVDARLLISETQKACSPKINSLYDGHRAAKHEIIIWSDSDVIVRPDYVRQMVASLQEPGVSLVTTPQYDTRADTFGSAFKVMANNCDVATFIMGYWLLTRRKRVSWGHSSGFWKADFDGIGEKAWPFLFGFLADDLGLPMLFDDHNKKVVFRNIYCPVETSGKTVAQMVEQKKRWVMCQRLALGNRFLYLSGLFFYPQFTSALLVLFSGFALWSIQVFFLMALLRIAISAIFERLFLGSFTMSLKYFWTIILWDLSQGYFFWHGFWTDTIYFRGTAYRINKDYSLVPESLPTA